MTPLHKRGDVSDPTKYRPVTVLVNESTTFESVIEDQFYAWIVHFIPDEQYGFLRDCGTTDYGARLCFTMLSVLERRGEGLLVILDVKGAFDRCWWSKLKLRFKLTGMRGRALRLIKDYLYDRFIQVVCNGKSSGERPIFSGVPQGAKLSPPIWDFDISELPTVLSDGVELGCYADDLWLWYEIHDLNRDTLVDTVNQDLEDLMLWSRENLTTFEPDKTAMAVFSNKRSRFDPAGVSMGGFVVEQVDTLKVTGFLFDTKLSWAAHIDMLVKKARQRLGALRNLTPYLDSMNMQMIYNTFIRSILEYGSVLFMGASRTHLRKLDMAQSRTEKLAGFEVESLQSRREAAAVSLALKLLDGDCRPGLQQFAPVLIDGHHIKHKHDTMHKLSGIQVQPVRLSDKPLDIFANSFFGQLPGIWAKLPQGLLRRGELRGWRKIRKGCKRILKSL